MKKQITIELKPSQINDATLIKKIIARKCHVNEHEIGEIEYLKRSIDARNRPKFILQADVYINENIQPITNIKSTYKEVDNNKKVIIIGAGPAGYFAALELLEYGIKPIVFERGKDVQTRRKDIKILVSNGIVNPNSNYCFGEGGAGAYSDGKLYTRSNKRGDIKKVLQILIEHDANPDILIDAHPHIGSNKLPIILSNIRDTIINHGGEIHFNSCVTDFIVNNNRIESVIVNNNEEHKANAFILATGHSARDIFYKLDEKKICIQSKAFAVGFRVEHYQELINCIQYGENYDTYLPPANYSLAAQVKDKGVFSFCMCPGGHIVPSVTGSRELVVNGMSLSGRNSIFANSGIVTSVDETDFAKYKEFGALAGLKYQEALEKQFFTNNEENPLKAPAQRMMDFVSNKESSFLFESSYIPGLVNTKLNNLLPKEITEILQIGIKIFSNKLKGFMTSEANVIGLESRTSSPIRIPRNKDAYNHIDILNLYPCGEGAGYAGGIVSSAIDGQNTVRALINTITD